MPQWSGPFYWTLEQRSQKRKKREEIKNEKFRCNCNEWWFVNSLTLNWQFPLRHSLLARQFNGIFTNTHRYLPSKSYECRGYVCEISFSLNRNTILSMRRISHSFLFLCFYLNWFSYIWLSLCTTIYSSGSFSIAQCAMCIEHTIMLWSITNPWIARK